MKKGLLSKEAARRVGHPELAGKEVEYTARQTGPEPVGTMAADVYYDGKRIAGTMSIGAGGIMPVAEE